MAITPQQAQQQLVRMGDPRAIRRALKNALRRGANAVRKDAVARFRSRGVGRRIFGSRKFRQKDAPISVGRARDRGDEVELDITAKGFAAIQEQGLRTAAHVIVPKNAPKLVFRVPGGLVITDKVNHPGAMHPRMPSVEPAIEKGAPEITREIIAAVDGHVDQALR